MGLMYEEQGHADHLIKMYLSNAFTSTGATVYLMTPFRPALMECGFIP